MIRATSLLLLALAVPAQAQTTVPFASLRATIKSIRFFPSSTQKNVPSEERVYRTSFDSATAKFINFELYLEYPKPSSAATIRLDCAYLRPGGKITSLPIRLTIEPNWDSSNHANGLGAIAGSSWGPGSYLVTCRDGSTAIASASFEVTRNRHDIPAIKGMVTRVRVLESPRRLPPFAERAYGAAFDSASARYISTQIELDFPRALAAAQFPIDCTYRFPNGETRNFRIDARVEATWNDSAHTGGWGNDATGTWPKGDYEISCQHLGKQIVQRTFQIK